MTYNQEILALASLFFDQGAVKHHKYESPWVNSIAYNFHGVKSSDFWTSDELYNDFYLLHVQQYTNYDPETWPEAEVILNPTLTNGHNVRIDVFALVEVLRMPRRLGYKLLDHAIEFALGKAVLSNSTDAPLVDMEELYRASVLMVGFGMAENKIVEWFDWQRPDSKLPYPKNGMPNFGEN